ncbi:hypothetical protein IP92_02397 [Pseudoduganella flava]|uniref:Uncharacterized protein n=1 Tax=Pseudoduganella flava TaxID=871742 RepID=A0A562PSH8_9BURK|nr:hypothetical protein [Pseudoduganella flava]QGZ39351.1 hypothetical protein GO485_10030 [Pseudoduganella flava]TWI47338.1 hypothetical protein IP92_02397 [Pseudoduganella flava]
MKNKIIACALAAFVTLAGAASGQDWTVRVDGAGPLKVGMDFDTVNRVLGDHLERTPQELRGSRDCFYVSPSAEPRIGLMFVKDVLKRVDVSEVGVRSERGIGVGDPAEKVREVYGEAMRSAPNAYNANERYLTVPGGGGQYAIRFETQQGTISGFYAGAWEQVQYVEGCL